MHFQIWIPDVDPQLCAMAPEPLIGVGLADLAQGFDSSRELRGPDGGEGRMFAWLSPREPLMKPAEAMRWIPAVAWDGRPAGRYLVGLHPVLVPTPADLQRPHQFAGFPVQLGGGTVWTVPEPARLPRQITVGEDGRLQFRLIGNVNGHVLDAGFIDEARQWFDRINAGEDEVPFDEALRFALRALSMNYRITPEVANELRLFDTSNVHRPLLAAVGGYLARELQQADDQE